MANRVVVQPNGLFARYSDVVDGFTHMNCTEAEMLEIYREECGINDALTKIGMAKANPGRFSESIATIRAIHGDVESESIERQCAQAQEARSSEEKA